jgi:hypothetical protein
MDAAGASNSATVSILVNQAALLRSSNINLSATLKSGQVTVNGKITVRDQNGVLLPGAVVYIKWTLPDGSVANQSATTNSNGIASFTVRGRRGTYTLTINNITKSGYTFDSANSVLTRSITR